MEIIVRNWIVNENNYSSMNKQKNGAKVSASNWPQKENPQVFMRLTLS